MEDLGVVDSINNAGSWLVRNQALLISWSGTSGLARYRGGWRSAGHLPSVPRR